MANFSGIDLQTFLDPHSPYYVCGRAKHWLTTRYTDQTVKMSDVWNDCKNISWLDYCLRCATPIPNPLLLFSDSFLDAVERRMNLKHLSPTLGENNLRVKAGNRLSYLRKANEAHDPVASYPHRGFFLDSIVDYFALSQYAPLGPPDFDDDSPDEKLQLLFFPSRTKRNNYLYLVKLYKHTTPNPFL